MEKDFGTVLLLDTYVRLLTEKQQRLCDMYYNLDYSLAEIAQIEKTTRQAARDGISKARQKLRHLEETLALCAKKEETRSAIAGAIGGSAADMTRAMNDIRKIWEA